MPHTENMTEANLDECQRVRQLLQAEKDRSGMTHQVLGKMIGKSSKTISAIVNGRMKITVPVARKLATVFAVPLADILPWTADLVDQSELVDIVEGLKGLNLENRAIALRMIRNLYESQND